MLFEIRKLILSLFKNRLVKASSNSFLIRLSYTALTFITSVVFARIFGVEGLGVYTYAVTFANVLSIPSTLGFKQVLVKYAAVYSTQQEWSKLKGLLIVSSATGLVLSIGLTVGLFGFFYANSSDSKLMIAISIALVNLPFEALRKLRLASLIGLNQTTKALLPEFLIGPGVLLMATVGWYVIDGQSMTVISLLQVKVAITLSTFALGAYWLQTSLPQAYQMAKPEYRCREWFKMSLPLSLAEGCGIINSRLDILMLGAISGPETAGIYSVVTRGTSLIQLVSYAVSSVIPPRFATLYAEGKREKLQKLCQKSTRILALMSAGIAVVIVVLGPAFLQLFGKDFSSGYAPLIVLSFEKSILVFGTSASYLLMMSGNEKSVFQSDLLGLFSNVFLNFILISAYGVMGAAIATTVSSLIVASTKSLTAYRSLGIRLV